MSISIQATPAQQTTTGSSTTASTGSDAQRAYTAATKDLRDAQQQLSKDTAAKAGEDTLKADQLAVQLAQAAVATAAAALAKEKSEAQQERAESRSPKSATPTLAPGNAVDLYT